MSADEHKSDISFMWLQSKPGDVSGEAHGWVIWKSEDVGKIVHAWNNKLTYDNAMTDEQEKSQQYFEKNVGEMATNLSLDLVTDATKPALIVAVEGKMFVYFGAMTNSCVHLACWLVLDPKNMNQPPGVCCCFLNSSFVQKQAELEQIEPKDSTIIDMRIRP